MAIHPTAIVEPGARVDPSSEIGAFAVVGPHVTLGPRNVLQHHAVVTGHTTAGAENRFFPFCVIGGMPQDLKYKGEPTVLEVGDRNTFREYVTVNTGTVGGGGVTRIANGGLFMANSHVGHDCQIGDGAIIANSVALAGHVTLEDHVHFGGLSASHQFCKIGRFAFVSGMTGIVKDVPPYCFAAGARAELAGINSVGLQRGGFTEEQVGRVKQAYKIFFRSNLQTAEALAQLEAELGAHAEVAHFIAFIKGSERGVTR
jgi:UDP-N-acetylglucosamine acyltransferase